MARNTASASDSISATRQGSRFARLLLFVVVAGVALAICVVVTGRIISARTGVPSDVGMTAQGTLRDCGTRSNCVSSDKVDGRLPLVFQGEPLAARLRLVALIRADGGEVRVQREDYVAAVFRSTIFGFPDDVEFLIDPASKTIRWRSASRLGRGDFGVNADRMKGIAAKWAQFESRDNS
jgi:uncharacterized protein (DUF1499 family)